MGTKIERQPSVFARGVSHPKGAIRSVRFRLTIGVQIDEREAVRNIPIAVVTDEDDPFIRCMVGPRNTLPDDEYNAAEESIRRKALDVVGVRE